MVLRGARSGQRADVPTARVAPRQPGQHRRRGGALTGADRRHTERLLDRLTDRHLLGEVALGWYELHDLQRAFAAELAADTESDTATARLRSWYLHSVRNARNSEPAARIRHDVPDVAERVNPVAFDSFDQAHSWLSAHDRAIRSLLRDADDVTVAHTAPLLYPYLRRSGATHSGITLFEQALAAAERLTNQRIQAICTHLYANSLAWIPDTNEQQVAQHQAAYEMFEQLGDRDAQVVVSVGLGTALARIDRLSEAVDTFRRGLDGASRLGDHRLVVVLWNNLATAQLEHGLLDDALETARQSVGEARKINADDRDDLGVSLITLGETHIARRSWPAAIEALDEAVAGYEDDGFASREILSRQRRGVAHRANGSTDNARADWLRCVELLDKLGTERVPDSVSRTEFEQMLAELE